MEKYSLDGVFFDYEFPITAQREIEFSDFLVRLDKTLGDDYVIGAALSHGWCRNTTKYDYIDYYDKLDRFGYMEDKENGVTASFNTPLISVAAAPLP